jgi:hypothetical protein
MSFIVEWWESMEYALKIFYAIALVSTTALLGQTVLMLLGFDDGDAHLDADMPDLETGEGGLHILSVRTIIAFLVGFGWTGVVALKADWHTGWVMASAVATGTAFMFGVFFLMKSLHSMRHSGTLNYQNALGSIGTVYLPIPANMEEAGQIEILLQSRLVVVDAYTRSSAAIPSQTKVKVTELLDQRSLIVEILS